MICRSSTIGTSQHPNVTALAQDALRSTSRAEWAVLCLQSADRPGTKRRKYSAIWPHGHSGSTSLSVISPAPGSRAPARRCPKPGFGCSRVVAAGSGLRPGHVICSGVCAVAAYRPGVLLGGAPCFAVHGRAACWLVQDQYGHVS